MAGPETSIVACRMALLFFIRDLGKSKCPRKLFYATLSINNGCKKLNLISLNFGADFGRAHQDDEIKSLPLSVGYYVHVSQLTLM